jgi:hypothetical protein
MAEALYHRTTPEIAKRRKELAPEVHDAFEAFSRAAWRTRRGNRASRASCAGRRQRVALAFAQIHPAGRLPRSKKLASSAASSADSASSVAG